MEFYISGKVRDLQEIGFVTRMQEESRKMLHEFL